jgi:hypothetical protein
MNRRFAAVALVVAGVLSIAGCASAPADTSAHLATATTTTAPAPATMLVAERANHTTVRLRTGQVVQVSLHSLYWSDPVSAPAGVLVQDGPVSRVPDHRCPMGGGCGTLTVRLHAAGPGTTQIGARRNSCGEAMGCTPEQSSFTVTVIVT